MSGGDLGVLVNNRLNMNCWFAAAVKMDKAILQCSRHSTFSSDGKV